MLSCINTRRWKSSLKSWVLALNQLYSCMNLHIFSNPTVFSNVQLSRQGWWKDLDQFLLLEKYLINNTLINWIFFCFSLLVQNKIRQEQKASYLPTCPSPMSHWCSSRCSWATQGVIICGHVCTPAFMFKCRQHTQRILPRSACCEALMKEGGITRQSMGPSRFHEQLEFISLMCNWCTCTGLRTTRCTPNSL